MAKFEFLQWLVDWFFTSEEFVFEWDTGNQTKSKTKHDVGIQEAEEVFYDEDRVPLGIQVQPIVTEPRFGLLGKSSKLRFLHTVFAIREGKVRIIATRPMHKKERALYEENIRQKREGI